MRDGPVVCDTGPLIALSLVDKLEILPKLYSEIVAPRAVLEEVTAGGLDRPGARSILSADWLETLDDIAPEPLLAAELGSGEAAAIAIAHRRRARLVLLDERKARRVAFRVYGLPVKGSAGLLVAAKRAGLVPEVRPLLEAMVSKGYYLSRRLVERATSVAGES